MENTIICPEEPNVSRHVGTHFKIQCFVLGTSIALKISEPVNMNPNFYKLSPIPALAGMS